jgi:isocitrate/isopropylmalate dehydrogenase
MMPVDGLEQLARHDAIFLGAVGSPEVSDAESLWGLLIPIRREFQPHIKLHRSKRSTAAGCTVGCGRRLWCRKLSSAGWVYPFWDEIVEETVEDHPGVTLTSELVDALAAHLVWKILVCLMPLGDNVPDRFPILDDRV